MNKPKGKVNPYRKLYRQYLVRGILAVTLIMLAIFVLIMRTQNRLSDCDAACWESIFWNL